jgi:hypothetical protein
MRKTTKISVLAVVIGAVAVGIVLVGRKPVLFSRRLPKTFSTILDVAT